MGILTDVEQLEKLDDFLFHLRANAGIHPGSVISVGIGRPAIAVDSTGGTRRFARGKVVTYTIEITEPGDPIAEMLQADEEKKGWEHMLRESASD